VKDRAADTTSRLLPDWGDPPWRVEATSSDAPLPARCDVVVIGGGFTGLSAAYHLARRGGRVVLLEASTLGAGASGRTGGIVLEGTAVGPLDEVERCLDTLALVVAEADIDCDLALPGCRELVHRAAPGSRRPFWRDGATWLCIEDTVPGGTIDPGALVTGLARAAAGAGVAVHERSAVHAIEMGVPARVHVGTGSVLADRIVVALNAYTAGLLALPVRLHSALTLAVCTEALAPAALEALGLSDGSPFYTVDIPYLWGRTLRDGRVVLGAGLVTHDDGDVAGLALHGPDGVACLGRLEARIAAFHPVLAGIALRERWGGPIAFTPSRTPVLSRLPGASNVVVSAGCAGHGIALGVRVGQLVAGALADGTPLPGWGALPA